MPTIYGYLRLKLHDQSPHFGRYKQMLVDAGATEIFLDHGAPYHRPEFYAMFHKTKAGDTVVVVRLAHLSTAPAAASALLCDLIDRKVNVMTLEPPMNTGEAGGEQAQNLIRGLCAPHRGIRIEEGDGGDH
jgi:DNA invertase Pin-like site-specific DNA recombinase